MKNIAIMNLLVEGYESIAYTDNYIYGFRFKGAIYMVNMKGLDSRVLMLDRASRGAGYSLRFKPTTDIKLYMLSMGATVLCSTSIFDSIVADSRYNRGEIFEKLVTEYYGQRWYKDSVPFTDGGDMVADGIAYQIKFEGATFTNERSLMNLMARR